MWASAPPTPYADVNAALAELLTAVQNALGARFVGMYLTGSLALGDFDRAHSDIDLLVVTDAPLGEGEVAALRGVHARFDAGTSPWAGRIEVVCVPRRAVAQAAAELLNHVPTHYPQVERKRGFVLDRLEDGWLAVCFILREHGTTLAGPSPQTLLDPVDPDALRRTVARIPQMWQNQAQHDPTWLAWLRVRSQQAFVVLTLCRLLYTLEKGAVVSKPAAARWAQAELGLRWAGFIQRALVGQHDHGVTSEDEVAATVALVELVVQRFG